MAKFTFDIDVYSDTVCPWCYIGKMGLDSAMETHRKRYPEDEFNLVWKPFILYPNAKVSAYDKKASFFAKFGHNTPALFERVAKAGAPYGITFLWKGRTGSSHDSHKLIMLAGDRDAAAAAAASPTVSKQSVFLGALFRGIFEQAQDISDRSFLIPTALAAGLAADEAEVLAYLDSDLAAARVSPAETTRARREAGVTAVPSYVVQGRFKVGGMQAPEVFLGLFERIRGREG